MTTSRGSQRRTLLAALGITVMLTFAACAGGGDEGSSAHSGGGNAAPELAASGDDAAADAEMPADGDSLAEDAGRVGSDGNGVATGVPALQLERAVISTAVVSLRSDDASAARAEVMRIVDVHRGQVSDEETSTDDDGDVRRSRLVLRVPAPDFAETVGELEKVGELKSSDKSSEDVSFQVIDTRVRIRAQEQSLRRIELLLERAETIRDIVSIESELTRRQAELDALKSKQDYLADQTTYATITVYLEQRSGKAPEKPETDESGFLAGLDDGWDALAAFATVLATIIGALLPWMVVLAVVGWPMWLLSRRLMRRRPLAPAPAAEG